MQIRDYTERLRALADQLAAPGADVLAIGRQLHSLASQIEHRDRPARTPLSTVVGRSGEMLRRLQSGATPGADSDERRTP